MAAFCTAGVAAETGNPFGDASAKPAQIARNAPSRVSLTTCDLGASPNMAGAQATSASAVVLVNDSYAGRAMRITWRQAVGEMDSTLKSGWATKQSILDQPTETRDMMTLISGLAYNGYAVAAQMVNADAQAKKAFRTSPVARALDLMVTTTTEPHGHDDELFNINAKVASVLAGLGATAAVSPFVASAVRGASLGDGIAEEASVRGLCLAGISSDQRKQIASAIERVRLKMPAKRKG